MKLADVVSGAGLAIYPEVGMVLFLLAFLVVLAQVTSPKRAVDFHRASTLPLSDAENDATTSTVESETSQP